MGVFLTGSNPKQLAVVRFKFKDAKIIDTTKEDIFEKNEEGRRMIDSDSLLVNFQIDQSGQNILIKCLVSTGYHQSKTVELISVDLMTGYTNCFETALAYL